MVPFDSSEPAVIGSSGSPTTFVRLDRPDEAGYVMTPILNNAMRRIEAIAFNSADNFLYAVDYDLNTLLRIDSTGSFENLFWLPFPLPVPWEGGTYTSATFGVGSDANVLYLLPRYKLDRLTTVDVTTGQSAAVQLSQPVRGNDMVYKDGLLWQFGHDSAYRIDPSTGAVDVFDVTALGLVAQPFSESYTAQWLYGNGNVGIATGDRVYQISISGADSEYPSFRLVDDAPAMIAPLTDGTSIAGSPVDVGLSHGGDETFTPGRSYEYTITLTNNGGGTSSGSRVEGTVPVGMLSPEVLTPGCTIAEGSLTCAFGAMQAGSRKTILVRGTVADGSTEDALRSTVRVVGNEADPVASNDDAVFAPKPVPAPALSLQASVDTTSVTVAGQEIVFSFPVTNAGNVEVRDVSVSGSGKASNVTCPADAEALAPGATVICSAVYTVVDADLTGNPIMGTVTAEGIDPDGGVVVTGPVATSVETVLPETSSAPVTPAPTTVATPRPSASGLAATGGASMAVLGAVAALLVMAGVGALAVRRRV